MKVPKHVEDGYNCDQCGKAINEKHAWYRLKYLSSADFCTAVCATIYRNRMYDIVSYRARDETIGNTD